MDLTPQLKQELKIYLQQKLNEHNKKVIVFSSYPLREEEIRLLKEKIPQLKNAVIENKIDNTLIAGVVVQFGSKRIDLSLKGELVNLQHLIHEYTWSIS